jgi:DNA-binding transcriptional MerR regulator
MAEVLAMNDKRADLTSESLAWSQADMPEAPATSFFSIGDLAREFGVSLRTLRFYEDKGLISPRREGLTRLYSQADRDRLAVILKGKRLGFTLTEVRALVAGGRDSAADLNLTREKCSEQIAILEKQKREIEQAIEELRQTHETLGAMLAGKGQR